MLTVAQFDKRVQALWSSQKKMAAAKYWKTGRRAGTVRTPAQPLYFDKSMLREWLWRHVGLNAITCPYLNIPIDIMSLTIDHIVPRKAEGKFALDNMECTSVEANEMKGDLSKPAFLALLEFSYTLSAYDRRVLHNRLKAAHSGSRQRFFRDNKRDRAPVRVEDRQSGAF